MIDRAEKVPKRSQKAILATFWPHFDTCLLHFQTLWTPLDLYTMIFQSIFGCFAKSMHTNFKEPSKSPEHPKCRNTSRCGGVASAFSISSSVAFTMDPTCVRSQSAGPDPSINMFHSFPTYSFPFLLNYSKFMFCIINRKLHAAPYVEAYRDCR